jgi:hypothetical protein
VLVLALVSAAAFWSVAPVLGLPALLAGPRLQRYEIINWNISNVSLILFVVGISLLGLAQLIRAAAVFRMRRRQYRELEALWTELRQAHRNSFWAIGSATDSNAGSSNASTGSPG